MNDKLKYVPCAAVVKVKNFEDCIGYNPNEPKLVIYENQMKKHQCNCCLFTILRKLQLNFFSSAVWDACWLPFLSTIVNEYSTGLCVVVIAVER